MHIKKKYSNDIVVSSYKSVTLDVENYHFNICLYLLVYINLIYVKNIYLLIRAQFPTYP